jgi:hypothetical protein
MTPFDREFDFSRMNEADVRAEIVDPMLRELGYQAGTEHNIAREQTLRYARAFLGRKKATDPPLRGRPDYILEVSTSGRWVIEVKPPSEELTVDDFEQAQSYSLHPNVAASIFVLTNGRELAVYASNAASPDAPLVRFIYSECAKHWPHLRALLTPAGFRRSVPPVKFDRRLPVADGYGAELKFRAGVARPTDARISLPIPEQALNMLKHVQTPLPRGSCERDENGELAIQVEFGSSTAQIDKIMERKGLKTLSLHTVDQFLSKDADCPSLFSGEIGINFQAGEESFDLNTWETVALPFSTNCYVRLDAAAHINNNRIEGIYSFRMSFAVANMAIDAEQVGEFELELL